MFKNKTFSIFGFLTEQPSKEEENACVLNRCKRKICVFQLLWPNKLKWAFKETYHKSRLVDDNDVAT